MIVDVSPGTVEATPGLPVVLLATITNTEAVIAAVPRQLETLRDKLERDYAAKGGLEDFQRRFAEAEGKHFLKRWWIFRDVHRRFGWKFWAFVSGGATLEDPSTTAIDDDVTIGADTVVGPGASLQGRTTVGAGCRIHASVRLTNATIGDRVTILDHSIVTDSTVADGASVGPFAHIRPGSEIASDARVGNFVELKKTKLGRGSKASHLAYLGDATIGEKVNVGAGTITCNYDGESKHPTVIEDGVFIGSDSQLIAPVTVDDFVEVNLARQKMPRKSTWFTPKARAGLVVTQLP